MATLCYVLHACTLIQVIKDWMLALGVLLLVVIDLIVLITYTAVEGARGNLSAKRVPNRENPEDMVGVSTCIHVRYIIIYIHVVMPNPIDQVC